jgi:hypothetical protein
VFENPDKFYLSTVQLLDPSRLSAKDPRTVEFYLWALREMVHAVHEKYPDQHIVPGSEIIFHCLLVTADRPDANQSELRALSFEVLCDFIRSCSTAMLPFIMQSHLPDIMNRIFIALSAPQSTASEVNTRSLVLSKLISCVASIFARFAETPEATAQMAAYLKTSTPNGLSVADNIATFFIQALPADTELGGGNMCAEEVLLAAAQMSKIVAGDFQKYLEVLNPRFVAFMQSVESGDLVYITCTSLGDIIRSLGPQIPHFPPQALLQWIHICGQLVVGNTDTNYGVTTWNSVKSIALTLISDIVSELGAAVNDQFRAQCVIALDGASNEVQRLCANPRIDDDDVDYAIILIQDLLGLWMSLAQAHKAAQDAQPGSGQVFTQSIPHVVAHITLACQFAQWIATNNRGDPAPILCSCANLVIDCVKCLGPSVADHLRSQPVVAELLNVSPTLNLDCNVTNLHGNCVSYVLTLFQRLSRLPDTNSSETLKYFSVLHVCTKSEVTQCFQVLPSYPEWWQVEIIRPSHHS